MGTYPFALAPKLSSESENSKRVLEQTACSETSLCRHMHRPSMPDTTVHTSHPSLPPRRALGCGRCSRWGIAHIGRLAATGCQPRGLVHSLFALGDVPLRRQLRKAPPTVRTRHQRLHAAGNFGNGTGTVEEVESKDWTRVQGGTALAAEPLRITDCIFSYAVQWWTLACAAESVNGI